MTAPSTPPLGERIAAGAGIVAILGGVFAALVWLWRRVDSWLVAASGHYSRRALSRELAQIERNKNEIETMQRIEERIYEELRDHRAETSETLGEIRIAVKEIANNVNTLAVEVGELRGVQIAQTGQPPRHTGPRSRFNELTPETGT